MYQCRYYITLYKRAIFALLCAATMLPTKQAAAQASPSLTAASASDAPSGQTTGETGPAATVAQPGILATETIPYRGGINCILAHPGIVAGSLTASANGSDLIAGQDFTVDGNSGTLTFLQPIKTGSTIFVSYRYIPGYQPIATANSIPGLSLNFGSSGNLGMVLGLNVAKGDGTSVSLDGINLQSNFGQGGQSHFTSMAYLSSSKANTDPSMNFSTSQTPAKPATATGNDRMIMQSLDLQTGFLHFNAQYQDVGKNFTGFSALMTQAGTDQKQIAQLKQLQSQRGIQKMGFGIGMGGDVSKGQQGMSLAFNSLGDGTGSIQQIGAALAAGGFKLQMDNRSVGETFSNFANLGDPTEAQWAQQKGMQANHLSLGLAFGSGKSAALAGGVEMASARYSDQSGSASNSEIGISHGPLSVSIFQSSVSPGFSRLANLTTSAKTSMALGVAHLYDPTAQANVIQPPDLAQVTQDAGMKRTGTDASLQISKLDSINFSEMSTNLLTSGHTTNAAAASGMSREAIGLNLGNINLQILNRDSSADFTQMANLPDVDKRYLALDLMREFNPAANLTQVTPILLNQVAAHEAGMKRQMVQGSIQINKTTGLQISSLHIGDTNLTTYNHTPTIGRTTLNYNAKSIQLGYMQQSISDAFTALPFLSPIETSQFGNEHGLNHQTFDFNWQVNKTTHLSVNTLNVSPTPQAQKSFLAANSANASNPLALSDGLQQQNIILTSPGLSISHGISNEGAAFTRGSDLALPSPTVALINSNIGYSTTSNILNLTKIKGLNIAYNANHAVNRLQDLFHNSLQQTITYIPNPAINFSMANQNDLSGQVGKSTGFSHQLMNLTDNLSKITNLTISQESRSDLSTGQLSDGFATNKLHLATALHGSPASVDYQVQAARSLNGGSQDLEALSVQAKPAKLFTVGFQQSTYNTTAAVSTATTASSTTTSSSTTPQTVNQNTQGCTVQYQATPKFVVDFGASATTSSDHQDGQGMTIGLTGQPYTNLSVSAQFNETHTQADHNTHEVTNVAVSNTKPVNIGPVQNLSVKYGYASLEDVRKLQNENMVGHVQWNMFKNSFLIDYSDQTLPNGQTTSDRTYSFSTDPNAKRWLHAGFFYEAHTLLTGQKVISRHFSIDARISKATHLVYDYNSLPDNGHGFVLPTSDVSVKLDHTFSPVLAGNLFLSRSRNTQVKLLTSSIGLGIQGSINPSTTLSLSYSNGVNGSTAGYDKSDQLQLSFQQSINANNFYSISVAMLTHEIRGMVGVLPPSEMQVDAQLHFIF